jgi:hypothetical protein
VHVLEKNWIFMGNSRVFPAGLAFFAALIIWILLAGMFAAWYEPR